MGHGKVWSSFEEAVADIRDGNQLAVGVFGLCGKPILQIAALV
ncbi:CoA-transferase, partial [Bacillus cereus]